MEPLRATDPRTVGEFALHGRLGAGGMGTVYLGVTRSGRPVAVKVIRAEYAADPAFRARFVREVAAARQVGGFWTASVVAADADAESPWLATEYVPGPSLQLAVTGSGPLPVATVRAVAARLAEALAAIHDAGLVHRDLKPANVLLAPDGPRVIDFGIARAFATQTAGMTAVIGTPSYMAPEQVRGGSLSPASDVFALGSTLVFAVLGRGPFDVGTPEGLVYRVVAEPPDLTGIPSELSALAAGCLAKEPAGRPTTAALLTELRTGASAVVTAYAGWRPPPHDPAAALADTVHLPADRDLSVPSVHADAPTSAPPEQAPPPTAADYPGRFEAGGAKVPDQMRPADGFSPEEPSGVSPTERPLPPAGAPSAMAARYVFPTERFRGEWRPHPIRWVQTVAAGGGIVALLGLLALVLPVDAVWFTVVLVLLGVVVAGNVLWRLAYWRFDRFILTNKRVMKASGIVTRDLAMLPLLRLTDMKYEQSPLGRIMNYGTFFFESAGLLPEALREVPYLPNPHELYLRVVEEMYEPAAVEVAHSPRREDGSGGEQAAKDPAPG